MKQLNERNRTRLTWLLAVALVFLYAVSESKWDKLPVMEESLFVVACLLAATGALGRAWCAIFISGRKDGVLVRQGPYALCRNPLYFFSFLGGLGVALGTETLTFPLIVLVAFAIYYPFIIKAEERRLAELFGPAFEEYRREVPCFFPRLSGLSGNEPEDYPVRTKTVRHALFDTLWFVWALGFIEFASAFHEIDLLPAWLILY